MNKSHSNLINKSDRFEDLSYSGSNAKNKSMSKITKNIDYEFIKNSLHDVKMNVKDCDQTSTIGYYDLYLCKQKQDAKQLKNNS